MMKHARGWRQEQARRRFVEALRRSLEEVQFSGFFYIKSDGVM